MCMVLRLVVMFSNWCSHICHNTDFYRLPIVNCCIVYNVYSPPIRVNQVHRVAGAVGVGRQVVELLTALPYRDPRGTNFVCTARDQSLSMLSSNE